VLKLPLKPYLPLIKKHADRRVLDPYLVAAVIMQESSGQQYAQRVERGFWRRYGEGILRWVTSTASPYDDEWARYPDIYCSSYGLMQIMLQTAAEAGFHFRFPGELFDPDRNIEIGCAILSRHRNAVGGDIRKMLLRYNGGGDPTYPDRVLRHHRALLEQRIFEP